MGLTPVAPSTTGGARLHCATLSTAPKPGGEAGPVPLLSFRGSDLRVGSLGRRVGRRAQRHRHPLCTTADGPLLTHAERRRWRRWCTALLTAVVAAVAVGCSASVSDASSAAFSFVSPGGQTELTYSGSDRQPISAISGPDLINQNATVSLADYTEKIVVLNFWGSWCAPCRAEAQGLANAATTFADRGVQFIGIDIKDTREGGADFHTFKKVPYPSIFDPSMRTLLSLRGYPATAIPSTIVLDRAHRVSHIYLLPVTQAQLADVITPLLNEKA